jgi:hypothetical protein
VAPSTETGARLWRLVRWLVTFNLVSIAFVFFRADSVEEAWAFLSHLATGSYASGVPPFEALLIVVAVALHFAERWFREHAAALRDHLAGSWSGRLTEGAALGIVTALTLAAMGSGAEFIYFQF